MKWGGGLSGRGGALCGQVGGLREWCGGGLLGLSGWFNRREYLVDARPVNGGDKPRLELDTTAQLNRHRVCFLHAWHHLRVVVEMGEGRERGGEGRRGERSLHARCHRAWRLSLVLA